ncbi:MAG: isopentenyl-diphosphate Delta-isomerase [Candidatus Gottesmanbacteria bacterium]
MEQVILVDEQNNEIGIAPKDMVHTDKTPLHRAFSLFLFNNRNQLLVTQRATNKKTFPGVWTNSVCGHVSPGEKTADAVKRRVNDELHIVATGIKEVSLYRYTFTDSNGIVENEVCPIFVGFTNEDPTLNKNEVKNWKWIDWNEFLTTIREKPGTYSPWSEEEAIILQRTNPELLQ